MNKSNIRELNGYRVIYELDHPAAMQNENWKGYVYEHILVSEKYLGRRLYSEEVVHHLDGIRNNNRNENLLVLTRGQHAKLHGWLDRDNILLQKKLTDQSTLKFCQCCDKTLQEKQEKYCSEGCATEGTRKVKNRPSKNSLYDMSLTMSREAIGREYNVSGNAVKKWQKQYGLI
jgi:hypothetical protein